MRNSAAPVPIDVLLTHRAWVGRVARALVRDPAAAEDLEQDVWLKAVRSGPQRKHTARLWLRTLLKRGARDQWRTRSRREAREQHATRSASVAGTDELVQRAETLRRVVDAVVALEEPYRSTILLRFWEDLPPRTVALRLGVPVETVRTRTRRAITQLRARFEQESGGNAWLAAIAPLARLAQSPGAVAASAAGSQATITGGLIMGAKAIAGGAAIGAVVGALTTAAWMNTGSSDDGTAEVAAMRGEVEDLRERLLAVESRAPGPALLSAPARTAAAGTAHKADASGPSGPAPDTKALAAQVDQARAGLDALARLPAPAGKASTEPKVVYADLTTDELLAQLRKMVSRRGGAVDGDAVLEATAVLLARGLDNDQRAEGMILKGIGHRVLQDTDAQRAAFNEAMGLAGPESERGREARIQLAWTDAHDGKPEDSAANFLALAEHPSANDSQRVWYRHYAGQQFEKNGDTRRARAEYQRIVTDFGEVKNIHVRRGVDEARRALKRLGDK